MTNEQRRRTHAALLRYGQKRPGNKGYPDAKLWAGAIEQTEQYYQLRDPIRAGVLRMRFWERRTEDYTIENLHIGRTTYKKALSDVLSTVAVFAAQRGAKI